MKLLGMWYIIIIKFYDKQSGGGEGGRDNGQLQLSGGGGVQKINFNEVWHNIMRTCTYIYPFHENELWFSHHNYRYCYY